MPTDEVAQSLATDIRFVRTLFTGLPHLVFLLLLTGLVVTALCTLMPLPEHRPPRVLLGIAALMALARRGLYIFNPNECFTGAVSVGTLLAFNAPLRALQFLVSPPTRATTSNRVNPLLLTLVLVGIPASALLLTKHESIASSSEPGDQRVRKKQHSPPAVSPTRGVLAALRSFTLASMLTYIVPARALHSSALLIPLVTAMTHGFTVLTTSTAALLCGVRVSAPFSRPWCSPSLSSFWAYRWNAPIAGALRGGVFHPVHARCGRVAGTLASFAASGLAHAVILVFGGVAGVGRWFLFFVVHGAAVCVERAAMESTRWSPVMRRAGVRRALFLAFTLPTTELLFIAVIRESHLFDVAMRELSTAPRLLVHLLRYAAWRDSV